LAGLLQPPPSRNWSLTMLKPSLANVTSHWASTLENLNLSIQDFYDSVEEKVRARNIPDVRIKRVEWSEGGIFSDKRLYLEVRRYDCIYHICGARFGDSFFVSSWLFRQPSRTLSILEKIPIYAWFAVFWKKVVQPETLFAMDTMGMFQGAVHGALMSAVDELVAAHGGRPLSEFERKPVLPALAAGAR
jgi:hypothetical protein